MDTSNSVKLISYTKPSDEFIIDLEKHLVSDQSKEILTDEGTIDSVGLRDLIAFCARVSNPTNAYNTETSDKLISYLMKHSHWSPFEMVSVCLEINTTRDIARQILRHRSFSFQEFSQRYSNVNNLETFTLREARLQDIKNRQSSIELDTTPESVKLIEEWNKLQSEVISKSSEVYNWAIANGISKEQARVVLPEGLTKTKLYMNGTVRSWIHYCQLRTGNGTQKEHAMIAREISRVINTIFPSKMFQ